MTSVMGKCSQRCANCKARCPPLRWDNKSAPTHKTTLS